MPPLRSLGTWLWSKRSKLKYNTVQIVSIKNVKLCLLHLALQLGIILYIAVYAIYIKQGYQASEPVSGSTALKVKGSAYNSGSPPWIVEPGSPGAAAAVDPYSQIYDSSDLVYPPTERDAVFVTTNLWITPTQERGQCYPGSDDWFNAQFPVGPAAATACAALCVRGTVVNEADTRSGGVWTGAYKVLPDARSAGSASPLSNCYCELSTWCPDENITPQTPAFHLEGVSNWTISVRQAVSFKRFDTTTSNMVPKNAVVPPIYTVEEILAGAGLTYAQIEAKGATVVMQMQWDCDLDHSADRCEPSVSFMSLGTGYNFRRVEFDRGVHSTRQLLKHSGLRLLIQMTGQGSRFDAAALFTNIGAGIGLLAVASLAADFAAVNLLGHRALYEKAKFRHVTVKDGTIIRGTDETRRVEEAMAQAALAAALQARAEGREVTITPLGKMDPAQWASRGNRKGRGTGAAHTTAASPQGTAGGDAGNTAGHTVAASPAHSSGSPGAATSPGSGPATQPGSDAGAGAGVEMQMLGVSPSPAASHTYPPAASASPMAVGAGAGAGAAGVGSAASNASSPRRPSDDEDASIRTAAGSHIRVHIEEEAPVVGGRDASSSTSARRRALGAAANSHIAWADDKSQEEGHGKADHQA